MLWRFHNIDDKKCSLFAAVAVAANLTTFAAVAVAANLTTFAAAAVAANLTTFAAVAANLTDLCHT